MMKGAQISCFLPLLKGSFSCWIWTNLGILVEPTFFFVLHMNIIYLVEKTENKKRMTIVTFQKEKKTELCYNLYLLVFIPSSIELCFKEHMLMTVIQPCTLLPSVRCGLEMAILNALATRQGSNLLGILHPRKAKGGISENSSTVQICALVDSKGTPTQVADVVAALVEEGFTAVKLKALISLNSHC